MKFHHTLQFRLTALLFVLGAVLIRDAAVLMLVVLVLRNIWRPDNDPVRIAGDDDPHGGVLDGAPDQLPALRAANRRCSA